MFSQLFGEYLVSEEVLTPEQLREVLDEQATAKVRLGTIAIANGYMTQNETEEVNHLQTQYDRRFGDIAVIYFFSNIICKNFWSSRVAHL